MKKIKKISSFFNIVQFKRVDLIYRRENIGNRITTDNNVLVNSKIISEMSLQVRCNLGVVSTETSDPSEVRNVSSWSLKSCKTEHSFEWSCQCFISKSPIELEYASVIESFTKEKIINTENLKLNILRIIALTISNSLGWRHERLTFRFKKKI